MKLSWTVVTQNELTEIIGIYGVSISENMTELQKLGMISRIGGDKGGHWETVKEESSICANFAQDADMKSFDLYGGLN